MLVACVPCDRATLLVLSTNANAVDSSQEHLQEACGSYVGHMFLGISLFGIPILYLTLFVECNGSLWNCDGHTWLPQIYIMFTFGVWGTIFKLLSIDKRRLRRYPWAVKHDHLLVVGLVLTSHLGYATNLNSPPPACFDLSDCSSA